MTDAKLKIAVEKTFTGQGVFDAYHAARQPLR
jgi:hypothetical protein